MSGTRDFDDAEQEETKPYDPVEAVLRRDREELRQRFALMTRSLQLPKTENPAPAAAKKPDLPKVKRYYSPPDTEPYDDVRIKRKLTNDFYAATLLKAVKEKCISIDRHLLALHEDHERKVDSIDEALNFLHTPYKFLMASQQFILDNKPHYDKFLPEVKSALKIIEEKSSGYHCQRSSLIQQIYAPFQDKT